MHDSAEEQPQVEQSMRASKSPSTAGVAMAHPARKVRTAMETFILK